MGNAKRRFQRRRARRRRLVTVGVVILVLAGAGAAYVLLDPLASDPPAVDAEGRFGGGPSALIYVDFDEARDLHRLDLDSRQDVIVTELPRSGNTSASPGSPWLAIEAPEQDEGRDKPILYLFDPDAGGEVRLGAALEPMFSTNGESLAVLRPVDESRCGEGTCAGDKVVVVIDLEDPETDDEISEPGRLALRAWAGDYLLVDDSATVGPPILQSISPDGEVADLPFLPKDFWGASPNGAYVIESGTNGTRFHDFSEGQVVDEGAEIPIPEGSVLGSGAWTHDSSRVAAFAVGDDGALDLVTFGPTDPEPQVLTDGGESSTGDVLWSPDHDALVFSRFNGSELEAVHCEVDRPDSCEVLFTWTRGISLLRVE